MPFHVLELSALSITDFLWFCVRKEERGGVQLQISNTCTVSLYERKFQHNSHMLQGALATCCKVKIEGRGTGTGREEGLHAD